MFLIEDVISVIGQFFTPRDLFLSSRVNSTWHKVLIYQNLFQNAGLQYLQKRTDPGGGRSF